MTALQGILDGMDRILLKEMDSVALLKRQDTKFVFSKSLLAPMLKVLQKDYRVLEVEDRRQISYSTLYFDNLDLDFFHTHHNGKRNRIKVRTREYLDSSLKFLEVKKKSNKGETDKHRIRVSGLNEHLGLNEMTFIKKVCDLDHPLHPTLNNTFKRITLVHKYKKERFTIDCDLEFSFGKSHRSLPNVVIAEVKLERASRDTESMALLKRRRVRPRGISKYCMGIVLLNPGLKYNNFKRTRLFIEGL